MKHMQQMILDVSKEKKKNFQMFKYHKNHPIARGETAK